MLKLFLKLKDMLVCKTRSLFLFFFMQHNKSKNTSDILTADKGTERFLN